MPHPPHYQTFLRWHDAYQALSPEKRLTIAITSSQGGRSSQLAELLAQHLNDLQGLQSWTWFDEETAAQIAEAALEHLDHSCTCESGGCPCQQMAPHLQAKRKRSKFFRKIASMGQAIIVTENAQLLIQDVPHAFHIRLLDSAEAVDTKSGDYHLVVDLGMVNTESAIKFIANKATRWANTNTLSISTFA